MTAETRGLPDAGPRPESLRQAIDQGIRAAIADFGVELKGCNPDTLTAHIIHELKRVPGWRPPMRRIETILELLALPDDTVVEQVSDGRVIVLADSADQAWQTRGHGDAVTPGEIALPVDVLREASGE